MSTTRRALIGVCQLTSTADKEHNFRQCRQLVREGAARGVRMLFLPEAFDHIAPSTEETLHLADSLQGELVGRYRQLARETGLWLSLGGFHERGPDWAQDRRIYNTHLLLDDSGQTAGLYRKTHLFDVDLPGQVSLKESSFTIPGPRIEPPVTTPIGKIGLAICYDLRFPEISRALADAGAEILTFPSAFTLTTGMAHWEPLLRSRAIETQCYVVAAAQTGRHNDRRSSFGHSMVVDPWGCVVAQCGQGPGLCCAEIDLDYLQRVRRQMPVIQHRRHDLYRTVGVHPHSGADL
ncbi:deaminated glutathione amidase [Pristis pectinata]|uniref:deaminated glutathione amidase n=1 Tax=Pristis pectinata TaxID=685728 RepID=UPI00223E3348|nr:deaminated glutathione amidase [Pristis pectinata]XP_051865785.1 deaminated glutathione amidase [Pristis pectinata]